MGSKGSGKSKLIKGNQVEECGLVQHTIIDILKYIGRKIQVNEIKIQDYEILLSIFDTTSNKLNDLIMNQNVFSCDSVMQKKIFTMNDLNDFIQISQLNRKIIQQENIDFNSRGALIYSISLKQPSLVFSGLKDQHTINFVELPDYTSTHKRTQTSREKY